MTAHVTRLFDPFLDSSTSSRAQRASARQQNGTASAIVDPVSQRELPVHNRSGLLEAMVDTNLIDDDGSLSTSNSARNFQEQALTVKGKRKDKGKGREIDPVQVKVKEEPNAVSLLPSDPS